MSTHVLATDKRKKDNRYHIEECASYQEAYEVARYVRERTDPDRWTIWTSGWHNGEPEWDRKAHMSETPLTP